MTLPHAQPSERQGLGGIPKDGQSTVKKRGRPRKKQRVDDVSGANLNLNDGGTTTIQRIWESSSASSQPQQQQQHQQTPRTPSPRKQRVSLSASHQQQRPHIASSYFVPSPFYTDGNTGLSPPSSQPQRLLLQQPSPLTSTSTSRSVGRPASLAAPTHPPHLSSITSATPRHHALHGLSGSSCFFGLIQEQVEPDLFKLLLSVILLNQTRGSVALPVFWDLLLRWPCQEAMSEADVGEVERMLRPLGLHRIRARRIVELARALVRDGGEEQSRSRSRVVPRNSKRGGKGEERSGVRDGREEERYPDTPISHLPGVGRYALDSWRIFMAEGGARVGLRGERPRAKEMDLVEKAEEQYWRRRGGRAALRFGVDVKAKVEEREETGMENAQDQGRWPVKQESDEEEEDQLDSDVSSSSSKHTISINQQPSQPLAPLGWRTVRPLDKELRAYLVWRWAMEGKVWGPDSGLIVGETASGPPLTLPDEDGERRVKSSWAKREVKRERKVETQAKAEAAQAKATAEAEAAIQEAIAAVLARGIRQREGLRRQDALDEEAIEGLV